MKPARSAKPIGALATLAGGGLVLALTAGGGCRTTTPAPSPADQAGEGVELPSGEVFTRRALLAAIATCVQGEATELARETQTLAEVVEEGAGAPSDDEAARTAWQTAIDRVQVMESMQVGPGATRNEIGGEDLRDAIYSWPLVQPCSVDEQVVAPTESLVVNGAGMDALEYLLFHGGDDNACDATAAINTEGTWAALTPEERASGRRTFAQRLARDVATKASSLRDAWRNGFADELADAGPESRYFRQQRIALNAISDALFYVEWADKDLKTARPAGLTGCETATCPEALESVHARRSKLHIRNNLVGFRKIFTGCGEDFQGLGFDDMLYAVGSPELGERLDQAIVAAIAAVDAIEEDSLADALEGDLDSVVSLHAALKAITDLMRTQFVSILDLELPKRIEGDND